MTTPPFITLTGIDNTTSLQSILDISSRYQLDRPYRPGLVEWGVLYSKSNQGVGRYPSLATIDKIAALTQSQNSPKFALHICGRAVTEFISGTGHVSEVADLFPRVQLNLCAANHDIDSIAFRLVQKRERTIITQHNACNVGLWRALAGNRNHAVLFDDSGGRGEIRQSWPAPLAGVPCGYAGGLGPGTLATELPRIHQAAAGAAYWVDMEGRLRDAQDRFDLTRAIVCLEIASRFFADHVAVDRRQYATI